jgi:hypothetical protein
MGMQRELERPPVEDAEHLSKAAWDHWRRKIGVGVSAANTS